MKKVVIISIFILLITGVFVQPEYSHAVDTTPPVLKGLVFKEPKTIQDGGYLTAVIDVEDDTSVSGVDFYFTDSNGYKAGTGTSVRLYDGKNTVKIEINGIYGWINGTYKLEGVELRDSFGNSIKYDADDLEKLGIHEEITVTGISDPEPIGDPPEIKSFVIRNPEAVDAKGYLTIDMDIENGRIGAGKLWFDNANGTTTRLDFSLDHLRTGRITAKVRVEDNLFNGANVLSSFELFSEENRRDAGRFYYDEEKDCYHTDSDPAIWLTDVPVTREINVYNSTAIIDYTPPKINSFKILNHDLVLPGILKAEMRITEDGAGIKNHVDIRFENEKGKELEMCDVRIDDIKDGRTGRYSLTMPCSPFKGEGLYALKSIYITDRKGNGIEYNGTSVDEICSDPNINLICPYNVSYEDDLGNVKGVLKTVRKMKKGETAVLYPVFSTVIPKAVFESIAGRDINLVFPFEDVEWIFNGKGIIKSRCKDVDIYTWMEKEKGKTLGFTDDDKVLGLHFANNGRLPGKAKIRINHEYISGKYAGGSRRLMLTHVSKKKMTVEDTKVPIENDKAAVITIDHNSKFVLSGGCLSLNNAKVTARNCVYSGALKKPRVTVKLNGRKIDSKCYKKKYGNNRYVGKANATATGNQTFGYKGKATGHFYINPKKAVISKVTAGKKKITVRIKSRPSQLGGTWYRIQYRIVGKSKWKSTKTTGKTKIIKNLRKGKRYQVRVRAYKGHRRGSMSATKKSAVVK